MCTCAVALQRPFSDINQRAADMWSYAILLWELATREVPFAELSPMEVGMKVCSSCNSVRECPAWHCCTVYTRHNCSFCYQLQLAWMSLPVAVRSCAPSSVRSSAINVCLYAADCWLNCRLLDSLSLTDRTHRCLHTYCCRLKMKFFNIVHSFLWELSYAHI